MAQITDRHKDIAPYRLSWLTGRFIKNPTSKILMNLSRCADTSTDAKKKQDIQEEKNRKMQGKKDRKKTRKNPAYGRHWISRPMRIVAPIPRRRRKKILFCESVFCVFFGR